jgi:hypothetical protein
MSESIITTNVQDANPDILRIALQAPSKFRSAMKTESTYPVIWESGASISISHDKTDFVGPMMESVGWGTTLKGIPKWLSIQGKGRVIWSMMDQRDILRHLKLPAYCVPAAQVCPMSTTSAMQTYSGEKLLLTASQARLSGTKDDPTKNGVVARTKSINNVPTCPAFKNDDIL